MEQSDLNIFSKNLQPEGKGLSVRLEEENLKKQINTAKIIFSELQRELDNREDLKDGISHLDMKNDTLLSYMIDVCNIVLRKVRGQKIEGHSSIERIVEDRVILEKVAGIDNGIKYQLNKIITATDADEGDLEGERMNIDDLDVDVDEDSNDDDDDDDDDEDDVDKGSGEEDQDDDSDDESDRDSEQKKKLKDTSRVASGRSRVDDKLYRAPKLKSVVYERKEREDHEGDFDDKRKTKFEEEHFVRLRANKRKKVPKFKGKKRSYRANK